MIRRVRAALAGAALLGALAGCGESESAREARMMAEAVPVRVAADGSIRLTEADRAALDLAVLPATEGTLVVSEIRYGQVRPRLEDEAVLAAPFRARVEIVPGVALGDDVAEGAPIVRLEPLLGAADLVPLAIERARIEGEIGEVEADIRFRAEQVASVEHLIEAGAIDTIQLTEARSGLEAARARLAGLEEAREAHDRTLGTLGVTLAAPRAGRLVALDAVRGAVAEPGAVLARVVGDGPRWVEVAVPPGVPPALRAEVETGGGWRPARVVVAGAVVAEDGARRDRLEVEPAAGLVLGASVAVRLVRGEFGGVILPDSALVPGTELDAVYVEEPAGVFTARAVRVAGRSAGQAAIASGLAPGERVVVRGALALRGEAIRGQLIEPE